MPSITPVRRNVLKPQPVANAPSGVPTTWNPSDVGVGFVLSNGNLTASNPQPPFGAQGGRSIANHSSGKYYWEIHVDSLTGGGMRIGIATSAWNENSDQLNTANGAVVDNTGVFGYNSSNSAALGPGYVTGDAVATALDLTNNKIWFRINSGNWNGSGTDNPATNTGGLSIAGFSTPAYASAWLNGGNNQTITARFSSTSWSFSAPSGFSQL